MPGKFSHQEAVNKIPFDFEPLETFPGLRLPWLGIHSSCGNQISPTLANMLNRGSRCKYCSGNMGISHEDAVIIAATKSFEPLETYPGGRNKPWKGIHLPCGEIVSPTLGNMEKTGPCVRCGILSRSNKLRSTEQEVRARFGECFIPLESFESKASSDRWRGIHTVCGGEVNPVINDVRDGLGFCSYCHSKFDRVYIVKSNTHLKFGISGNSRRVMDHSRRGFDIIHKQWRNLSHKESINAERFTLLALKELNISPATGREYFAIQHLQIVDQLLSGRLDSI